MTDPGDGLRFHADPAKGCRCGDPRCKARVTDPRRAKVLNLQVNVDQLRANQSFTATDAAALGEKAYRAMQGGHIRVREPEHDRRPEFVSAEMDGREILVPTHGMRDVHEIAATVGELLTAQAHSAKRERYAAYRQSKRRDVVVLHQEFNEALLQIRKANLRTVKEKHHPSRPVKGQSQVYMGEKRAQALR
jgi:hypothetical protein